MKEKNIKMWERLSVDDRKDLIAGNWSRWSGEAFLYKCVVCEGKITLPIMKFYGFQPDRFTCYKCQGSNK